MIEISRVLSKFLLVCFVFVLTTLIGCTSVQSPPAPQPNPRTFLKLSLEFLDEYRIPKDEFQGTPVGGLSAIDYDPVGDRYYVLSDDRSQLAPARFYTMKLSLDERGAKPQIRDIQLETMTSLINAERENFLQGSIDPEGLALSPRNSLFIASEGDTQKNILPFVKEFTFDGEEIENLRMPKRFLPISPEQGIQNNLGFEALALSAPSIAPEDPFRIFFAPESSLRQDKSDISEPAPIRLLHYVVNPIGDPVLIAEHLYPLEPTPDGVISNGLVELIALPQEGYLLSLERTYGIAGANAKLFQVIIGNATDTSRIDSVANNPETVVPIQKILLLDLKSLGIAIDNLEGMTLGQKFADGSHSLILISDDNFSDNQLNQVLLFRLKSSAASSTSK